LHATVDLAGDDVLKLLLHIFQDSLRSKVVSIGPRWDADHRAVQGDELQLVGGELLHPEGLLSLIGVHLPEVGGELLEVLYLLSDLSDLPDEYGETVRSINCHHNGENGNCRKDLLAVQHLAKALGCNLWLLALLLLSLNSFRVKTLSNI